MRTVVYSTFPKGAGSILPPRKGVGTDQGLSPALLFTLERDDDDGQKRSNENPAPTSSSQVIDQRLQQLTNGRWLRPWRRRGELELHPPLISEVDASGVDRHLIAKVVSPLALTQLEEQVRRERKRLCEQHTLDREVVIWSFQHLLLQALQDTVLQQQVEIMVEHPHTPQWSIGDKVGYCGEQYIIGNITTKKLSLLSDIAGEVDIYLNSPEVKKLKPIKG